jgi:hypothetical protein
VEKKLISEASTNLSWAYRSFFIKICQKKLLPDEQVLFAADSSIQDILSFFFITTYRAFQIKIPNYGTREEVVYKKTGSWLGYTLPTEFIWFLEIGELDEEEISKSSITECRLKNIHFQGDESFTVKYDGEELNLVVLQFDARPDFFEACFRERDATIIYNLLQYADKNAGTLSLKNLEAAKKEVPDDDYADIWSNLLDMDGLDLEFEEEIVENNSFKKTKVNINNSVDYDSTALQVVAVVSLYMEKKIDGEKFVQLVRKVVNT